MKLMKRLRIYHLINKINLPLYTRIFIDDVIDKANVFSKRQKHKGIAYCCYVAYQWYKIENTTSNTDIIIDYIHKNSIHEIKLSKLKQILLNCGEDIKNCYDENVYYKWHS